MISPKAAKVIFQSKVPKAQDLLSHTALKGATKTLLIFDEKLKKNSDFKLTLSSYDFLYPVTAGESLKALAHFPGHMKRLLQLTQGTSANELCVVAAGGGSVGDFAGFLASVYKRGTRLVHLPSTWLAALDSSHGGKTALNVAEYKNQVGSFYSAALVIISKKLLKSLPAEQELAALGELHKMAILSSPNFFSRLEKAKKTRSQLLWEFLPKAVKAKYKVVKKDPYEKTGERQILNLGHTFGHVLESHYQLPHGFAITYGLLFSLEWSYSLKRISTSSYLRLKNLIAKGLGQKDLFKNKPQLTQKKLLRLLQQDKKVLSSGTINFIFINGVGQVSRKKISFQQLLDEARRQGWLS